MKKTSLTTKTADEAEVERDTKIRKRIKAIYNKPSSAFENLDDFHDYEEYVEDMIFNLVNGINEAEINQQIEAYKSKNIESITLYQSKAIEAERSMSIAVQNEMSMLSTQQRQYIVRKHDYVCLLCF